MTEKKGSAKKPKAKRKGAGRPSKKQEMLARLTLINDPENASDVLFGHSLSVDDLVEARGVREKLVALSGKIEEKLEHSAKGVKLDRFETDAAGDDDPALIRLRAWANQDSPENVVSTAEALHLENDRVISALLSHLAEHMIIADELKDLAASARRRAADELARVPAGMLDFIGRLYGAGIVVDDVRKMSVDHLDRVVRAISRTPGAEAGNERQSIVRDDVDEQVETDASATDPENPDSSQEIEAVTEIAAVPPGHSQANDNWDHLDLTGLGYRVEEFEASPPEMERANRIRLPSVSKIDELPLAPGPETVLANGAIRQSDHIMLENFLRRWGKRNDITLSQEEQRLWGLLLVEMPFRNRDSVTDGDDWLPRRMGNGGWFHNLVMPPRRGSTKIRRIVAEDQSPEALKRAFSPAPE